jgi:hypothetical protein
MRRTSFSPIFPHLLQLVYNKLRFTVNVEKEEDTSGENKIGPLQ